MSDAVRKAEEQLVALELEWIDAVRRRDAEALDRLLADDFLAGGGLPLGRLADKKLYTEDCLMPAEELSFSHEPMRVRVYGGAAVVNFVVRFKAVVAGAEVGGAYLLTDVWAEGGGVWRAVMRHASALAAAPEDSNG